MPTYQQVARIIRSNHLPMTDAQRQRVARGFTVATKTAPKLVLDDRDYTLWAVESSDSTCNYSVTHSKRTSGYTCTCPDARKHQSPFGTTLQACKHISAVVLVSQKSGAVQ